MVLVKIRARTVPGQAERTGKNLEKIVFRIGKADRLYYNDDNSEILLEKDVSVKEYTKIVKRVSEYKAVTNLLLSNGGTKKLILKAQKALKLEGDFDEVKKMVTDHTEVEVVNGITTEEWAEYKKPFITKIKQKLTGVV